MQTLYLLQRGSDSLNIVLVAVLRNEAPAPYYVPGQHNGLNISEPSNRPCCKRLLARNNVLTEAPGWSQLDLGTGP